MSEQQNIDAVGKIYEAFGRGDIGYIVDQCTDDVHWFIHAEPVLPWAGDYSGKDNIGKFFAAIDDNAETTAFVPKEFVAQGDTVVSTGDYGCKVRATGKEALAPWVFIWKLRDGRVFSYEQFHGPQLAKAFR